MNEKPHPGRRLAWVALVSASLWGCASSLVEVGGELDLQIEGPATVALSDSMQVTYEARGRNLLGLILTYGDGTRDSLFFRGSQSAGGRASHKYDAPGTYRVTGTVQDGIEGSIMAEFTVTVTP